MKNDNISNDNIEKQLKDYFNMLASSIRQIRYGYKFLSYESACSMLAEHNIQFTRGDRLNDENDLSVHKIDFSGLDSIAQEFNISKNLIEEKKKKIADDIKSFSVCSMGSDSNNDTLWNRYARSTTSALNDGVCIKIDLVAVINYFLKQNRKVVGFPVLYKESTKGIIKAETMNRNKLTQMFSMIKLFQIKEESPWKDEGEIRLILPKITETEYTRIQIPTYCFCEIILGEGVDSCKYNKLKDIINSWAPSKPIKLSYYVPKFSIF